jgi:hypothetical protein
MGYHLATGEGRRELLSHFHFCSQWEQGWREGQPNLLLEFETFIPSPPFHRKRLPGAHVLKGR